jgi:hypothetical protein
LFRAFQARVANDFNDRICCKRRNDAQADGIETAGRRSLYQGDRIGVEHGEMRKRHQPQERVRPRLLSTLKEFSLDR